MYDIDLRDDYPWIVGAAIFGMAIMSLAHRAWLPEHTSAIAAIGGCAGLLLAANAFFRASASVALVIVALLLNGVFSLDPIPLKYASGMSYVLIVVWIIVLGLAWMNYAMNCPRGPMGTGDRGAFYLLAPAGFAIWLWFGEQLNAWLLVPTGSFIFMLVVSELELPRIPRSGD
jgi:hypothetical protein